MQFLSLFPRWAVVLILLVVASPGLSARDGSDAAQYAGEAAAVKTTGSAIVVAGHPLATEAGMSVLRRGGNAMDAAVAVALSLGVVEPFGSGMGGKFIMLHFDQATKKVTCLEALEMARPSLDTAAFIASPAEDKSRGYSAACIPGLPAGLYEAHRKFGSQPWKDLVAPAIKLARDGFPVNDQLLSMLQSCEATLRKDPAAAKVYAPKEAGLRVGSILRNEDLAQTMEVYAKSGPASFYEGETAKKIVAAYNAAGQELTLADMKSYQPRWQTALRAQMKGLEIYSSPPPLTGGSILLLSLGALQQRDWKSIAWRSPAEIDQICRVVQLVYKLVERSAADLPDSKGKIDDLLAPDSIRKISEAALHSDPANPPTGLTSYEPTMDDSDQACTTHFCVRDARGNVVSVTQSLGHHFGAGVIPAGTGVILNSGMSNFGTRTPSSPNYVAAGKRPRSTVTPTIVLKNGEFHLAIGAPAGQRIPTGVLQVMIDLLEYNKPLDEAIAASRFHLRRPTTKDEPPNLVDLEEGVPEATVKGLEQLGYQVEVKPISAYYFGGVNAILALPKGGFEGVADKRRMNTVDAD